MTDGEVMAKDSGSLSISIPDIAFFLNIPNLRRSTIVTAVDWSDATSLQRGMQLSPNRCQASERCVSRHLPVTPRAKRSGIWPPRL